jgi:itaconyl-CoA hydratase
MSAPFFEDFVVGDVIRHARGKTLGEMEVVTLCHLVLNSADAHFDNHRMTSTPFGRRVSFGAINVAVVVGLTACDTAQNAVAEIGIDAVQLSAPVFEGDTLYAYSEVLAAEAEDARTGMVRFRHYGVNQREALVCSLERTVRMRRRDAA